MKAAAAGGTGMTTPLTCRQSSQFSSHSINFTYQTPGFTIFTGRRGLYGMSCYITHKYPTYRVIESKKTTLAVSSSSASPWGNDDDDDDSAYEVLPGGKRVYLDELDVVSFLDPPKELIPFDPSSYNPAAYLWKKIDDVPEERRHRLLHLLQPRLVTKAWEISGMKYDDPKLAKRTASSLLSDGADSSVTPLLEFWNCRFSGGPMPLSWINFSKKAIFRCKDGTTCGRLVIESFVGRLATSFSPLYFKVSQLKEIMSTEHPCDFAYHFGDGVSDIHDYPPGFPEPAKHPWPFNDQVVIYIRHLGPGVLVGQAWQEGEDLEKLPQKLCNEILMVKDYSTSK